MCLATPIFASSYHDLNSISESPSPSQIGVVFPIHYVYGWLSAYFNTHFEASNLTSMRPKMVSFLGEGGAKYYVEADAHKQILKGDSAYWLYTSQKNDKDFIFHDDGKGNEEDFEYFICLRPYFLVLRRGLRILVYN